MCKLNKVFVFFFILMSFHISNLKAIEKRLDLLQSYLWMKTSGEYTALCRQAYYLAKIQVNLKLKKNIHNKYTVVLDLDETVISNIDFFEYQQKNPKASWMDWAKKGRAKLVPGALNFLNYLVKNKINIFYVTNRPLILKKSTLSNLTKLKIPFKNSRVFFKKSKKHSKEARRTRIRKRFNIILLLGDNLGDFSKNYDKLSTRNNISLKDSKIGSKYIIFPNSLYGGWERAIFSKTIYSLKERIKILKNKNIL